MEIKRTVFISGANRGIGYELVHQMANQHFSVVAGYRDKDRSNRLLNDAQKNSAVLPFQVDVTVETDLEKLQDFIMTKFGHLDILINNAGINVRPDTELNKIDWSDIAVSFMVNVGGPFLTTKYLYPLLLAGKDKKIINVSSKMASITLSGADAMPYRTSKAALNMLTKNQSERYKRDGVAVISMHPGWVRTDMGGDSAHLSSKESARQILQIVNQITISKSGKFLDINGDLLPH